MLSFWFQTGGSRLRDPVPGLGSGRHASPLLPGNEAFAPVSAARTQEIRVLSDLLVPVELLDPAEVRGHGRSSWDRKEGSDLRTKSPVLAMPTWDGEGKDA